MRPHVGGACTARLVFCPYIKSVRSNISVLLLLCSCAVSTPEQESSVPVVFGKSVKLDQDQPLICVYFHDKKTLVCLPPEEAFEKPDNAGRWFL